MLERSDGMRIPHRNGLFLQSGADTVGNDPVCGKVPSSDDIASSRCGNSRAAVCKEGVFIAVRHQLGAGLAVGIRIESIQGVCLPVSPLPFPVMINLICSHIQKRFHRIGQTDAFQHVHCSHYICLVSIYRAFVGFTYNGLCGQMEYDLRLRFCKNSLQLLQIPDIADHRAHLASHIRKGKKRRLRRRFQSVSRHLCPCSQKQAAEPRSLKACMPCHQNLFSFIKCEIKFVHIFSFLLSSNTAPAFIYRYSPCSHNYKHYTLLYAGRQEKAGSSGKFPCCRQFFFTYS